MNEIVPVSPVSPLALAGAAADRVAARNAFEDYRSRRAAHTLRRQDADLALFAEYLSAAGVAVEGGLSTDPSAWQGVTWGIVSGFVRWQVLQGYAVGSINVRLATVKRYCQLATQAGVIPPEVYAMIKTVAGYRHAEGRKLDEKRGRHRRGSKKAEPVTIGADHAAALKNQPLDTPQGRRDALLMCLLLDHGLRVGEIAALPVGAIDLARGELTFYRPKVNKWQTHRLTADTLRTARAYLTYDAPAIGPLLRGSRRNGELAGAMSERAIAYRVRLLGGAVGLKGLSPHDCRHYWATAAVRGGTDVRALQEAGGWSSPAMPLRYVAAGEIANEGVTLAG